MNIFYDPQIFVLQPRGGISKYIRDLMGQFSYKQLIDHNLSATSLLECQRLMLNQLNTFQILHHSYHLPLLVNKKIKRVVTIHDLIWEDAVVELTKKQKLSLYFKEKQLRQASGVICVSENTYERAMINYPFLRNIHLKVIKHGVELQKNKKINVSADFQKLGKYILYVGKRHGYKNCKILLEAYLKNKELQKLNLVLVGGEELSFEETNILMPLLNNKVFHLQNIKDDELQYLYKKSAFYISTSKAEGFGYPIVEALKNGTSCICSNIPVYKELFSDFVTFFRVDDSASLSRAINNHKNPRVDVNSAFSFQNMIQQHKTFYQTL